VKVAPIPAVPDADLVRRALSGDGWAEEAIYRRHAPLVLGLSKRLLADSGDAEDVTQETFEVAFESFHKLREPERLRQWLIQIAVSKVHRRFRRRKLLRALGFQDSMNDATLDLLARADCSQETHAELALLAKALDKLSGVERVPWMLRYVEGMSLQEIAQECGCSLAAVKRRIGAAAARIERFCHGARR
jgi:RNA polymerase sigma-70 factor (ECF subfamily)